MLPQNFNAMGSCRDFLSNQTAHVLNLRTLLVTPLHHQQPTYDIDWGNMADPLNVKAERLEFTEQFWVFILSLFSCFYHLVHLGDVARVTWWLETGGGENVNKI